MDVPDARQAAPHSRLSPRCLGRRRTAQRGTGRGKRHANQGANRPKPEAPRIAAVHARLPGHAGAHHGAVVLAGRAPSVEGRQQGREPQFVSGNAPSRTHQDGYGSAGSAPQLVEEFNDGYWSVFRAHERTVRDALTGGRRHLHEARMKAERR
jgi:hypothetical protein